MVELIVLVISNVNAFISKENIKSINKNEGTDYPEHENTVTYKMLYDSREGLGSQRGYFREKNGVEFYIIPYIKNRVLIDKNSSDIVEYSIEDYEKDISPNWDKKQVLP